MGQRQVFSPNNALAYHKVATTLFLVRSLMDFNMALVPIVLANLSRTH
jgi:hypothetical protein